MKIGITQLCIEGDLEPGEKVAVVEDTITTGASALRAVDAVKEAGADPVVILALADREDPEAESFRQNFDVKTLVTLSEIRGQG